MAGISKMVGMTAEDRVLISYQLAWLRSRLEMFNHHIYEPPVLAWAAEPLPDGMPSRFSVGHVDMVLLDPRLRPLVGGPRLLADLTYGLTARGQWLRMGWLGYLLNRIFAGRKLGAERWANRRVVIDYLVLHEDEFELATRLLLESRPDPAPSSCT